MTKQETLDVIAKMGLTVTAKFVPFSQSRAKAEKSPSLNWIVTVLRNGREVLTTEYGAGMGHCPGHAAKATPSTFQPARYRSREDHLKTRYATATEALNQYRDEICAAECESGVPMEIDRFYGLSGRAGSPNAFKAKVKAAPILPDAADVIYSLTMDSSVLDHGTFEDWAADFGYDTDSRKGESVYRACLEIALKLRNGVGESGLSLLREAFEDF